MRKLITYATAKAKEAGQLFSITTRPERVTDKGIEFYVQVAASLYHKKDNPVNSPQSIKKEFFDPFENPSTQPLFLKHLTPTHSLMLNKFNVVENHILVVTTKYESQTAPLNKDDFEAIWMCVSELNGVGYFNCGVKSGASQPHKHLQFVPFPIPNHHELPISKLIEQEKDIKAGTLFSIDYIPFIHYCFKLGDNVTPDSLLGHYKELIDKISILEYDNKENGNKDTVDYNLLIVPEWMMIVPRRVAEYEDISVNALGFTGTVLVKSEELLNKLKELGPMTLLQKVTFPRK